MERYIRNLRTTLAEIISNRDKKKTTLEQYWIVDTETRNALAFIMPEGNGVKTLWLKRKLEKKGWAVLDSAIIKSAGRDKSVSFVNMVVRCKNETGKC